MVKSTDLLTDFVKDILKTTQPGGDPMQRKSLVDGYAASFNARDEEVRRELMSKFTNDLNELGEQPTSIEVKRLRDQWQEALNALETTEASDEN